MATETESISEAARRIGALGLAKRQPVDHICPVCGAAFRGRPEAIYDRSACRTRATRDRRKKQQKPGSPPVDS